MDSILVSYLKMNYLTFAFPGLAVYLSRAAHRRIYSFFTALRAPSFLHIYTNKHTFPLPQLVQAVTLSLLDDCLELSLHGFGTFEIENDVLLTNAQQIVYRCRMDKGRGSL
jgi:hypothetical protein